MYATGHYGVSLLLFAPVLALLFLLGLPALGLIGATIVVLTATLPDIDIKPPFRYFMPHRGPTHTLWFALLTGAFTASLIAFIPPEVFATSFAVQFWAGFLFGVFGIFGHLAGDVITPSGIRPLWPVGPRYSYHITSAKGVWWFEDIKSGNQNEMTFWESIRHKVLNSNRVFLVLGLAASGASFTLYAFGH